MASQKVPKSSKIKASHAKILHDAGYTKCLLPFGILIVANGTFENAGLLSTTKIVAELIDQDRNGIYFYNQFNMCSLQQTPYFFHGIFPDFIEQKTKKMRFGSKIKI